MNQNYEIYQAPKADIPKEDIYRLEGYLKGRAEEAAIRRFMNENIDSGVSEKKRNFF